ncbi:unnamed protein product [Strongylus vulgaris]|uniref:Uncharacterized protein n=1 Tax=Strongylus vulgaris TaxID=40348 RepID=A0A3P7KVZ9_STRVU|nr:unnamed protein product [Strongylus vulgaris]
MKKVKLLIHSILSFVLSTLSLQKLIQRLSKPYGDCIQAESFNKTDYIYQDYDYHPEGCHRSCFQTNLLRDCACGDPRFPVPKNSKHCSAFNATAKVHRNCARGYILNQSVAFGSNRRKQKCHFYLLGDCDGMTETECENYYRLNAAMVEVGIVYYRDSFRHSPHPPLARLLSGFSVITVMEVIVLVVDVMSICFRRKNERMMKKERSKDEKAYAQTSSNEKTKSLVQI